MGASARSPPLPLFLFSLLSLTIESVGVGVLSRSVAAVRPFAGNWAPFARSNGAMPARTATHSGASMDASSSALSPSAHPRKKGNRQKKRDLEKRRADMETESRPRPNIADIGALPRHLFTEDPTYRPEGSVDAWCVGASLDLDTIRERFFRTTGILALDEQPIRESMSSSADSSSILRKAAPGQTKSIVGGLSNWLKESGSKLTSAVGKGGKKDKTVIKIVDSNPLRRSVDGKGSLPRGTLQTKRRFAGLNRNVPEIDLKITSVFDEVLFGKVGDNDVFLFDYGVVVAWGASEAEMKQITRILKPYTLQAAKSDDTEHDEMKFAYWKGDQALRPPIRKDTFPLVTSNTFEKLAYSYAFAQSTKLSVFETIIDTTIEKTKRIPESLAKYGTTWMSRRNIAKQLGQLFVLRCNVNLQTDILDTPEILWDFDEWESLYMTSKRYLGVAERVDILNQRLDVIKDLYNILNDELGVQQSHREGQIIIALISLELLVEIFKELLDIPAIATWFHNLPAFLKSQILDSPFKFCLFSAILSVWLLSPIIRFYRSLRAKWAYQSSLRLAQAHGGMYLEKDDGMIGDMLARLRGTGADARTSSVMRSRMQQQ
mmetsp:Transcript_17930/g.26852  ORF Transcript_17930/g.26852 Transcript_17930/m.26852 type:complete len:603 (+) Transcript_17930:211-2019(+)